MAEEDLSTRAITLFIRDPASPGAAVATQIALQRRPILVKEAEALAEAVYASQHTSSEMRAMACVVRSLLDRIEEDRIYLHYVEESRETLRHAAQKLASGIDEYVAGDLSKSKLAGRAQDYCPETPENGENITRRLLAEAEARLNNRRAAKKGP